MTPLREFTAIGTDASPAPGDITICLCCGHLMAFADDLSPRALTDAEMVAIAGDRRVLAVQHARGKVMNKGKGTS